MCLSRFLCASRSRLHERAFAATIAASRTADLAPARRPGGRAACRRPDARVGALKPVPLRTYAEPPRAGLSECVPIVVGSIIAVGERPRFWLPLPPGSRPACSPAGHVLLSAGSPGVFPEPAEARGQLRRPLTPGGSGHNGLCLTHAPAYSKFRADHYWDAALFQLAIIQKEHRPFPPGKRRGRESFRL